MSGERAGAKGADSQETTGEEISEEDAWRDLMGVGWEERTRALMRDEEEYSETWDDIFDYLISDSERNDSGFF
ncbi:unnamed protein product [Gordionus sp. m RMFG-2023]